MRSCKQRDWRRVAARGLTAFGNINAFLDQRDEVDFSPDIDRSGDTVGGSDTRQKRHSIDDLKIDETIKAVLTVGES